MIRRMEVREDPLDLAILGAGYVGLVTAACLARLGFNVRCIDRDAKRIEGLQRGVMPFFEPGLEDAVLEGSASGRLQFSHDPAFSHGAAAVFLCIGTLDERGDWSPRDVERALAGVVADKEAPRTIVVRSTLMPTETARMARIAADVDPSVEIAINPEFTRQGNAVGDFLQPDRVVVGLTRPETESRALPLLQRVYLHVRAPILVTDAASAELIKTGSNVFLALKAGFANELARLAAATGADVAMVVDGIGLDTRIGRAYLTPGPGIGGSCLPSQTRSLPDVSAAQGVHTPIIDSVATSNSQQAEWIADQVEREIGALQGKRVAVLGLAFKAGTDDVRESPALAVSRALAARGAQLAGHDPLAQVAAQQVLAREGIDMTLGESAAAIAAGADAIVVATEWPEYANLDWAALGSATQGRVVVDSRRVVDQTAAAAEGFKVVALGRIHTSAV
jgi:UDPglucose 6-dehydrogenase